MTNMYNFFKNKNDIQLLIVSDDKQAQIANDIVSYCGKVSFVLNDFRANFGDDLLAFGDELRQIIQTLHKYHTCKKQNKILIAPIRTISFALPKQKCFDNFTVEFGENLDIQLFKNKLYSWGYYFVDIVTSNGEISIRGDIIDIYLPDDDFAYRISLFDTQIESIRKFNIQSQRSFKDELNSINIKPVFLALNNTDLTTINNKIEASSDDIFLKNIHSLGFWYLDDLGEFYTRKLNSCITKEALNEIDEAYIFDKNRIPKVELLSTTAILSNDNYKQINPANIKEFLEFHKDKKITIISTSEAKIRNIGLELGKLLPQSSKNKSCHTIGAQTKSLTHWDKLSLANYGNSFVVFKPYIINLLGKDEVIISLNKEVKKKQKQKVKIILDELQFNDFVVHQEHGIGQFKGIEPIVAMGAKRDFVKLLYANDDKLFIPVENLDVIDRYVANSGDIALLDKLGKKSFAKLKEKVKEKLFAIANDIITLAAKRELTNGIKININKQAILDFQKNAGFIYTKDQIKSIKELFDDLSSGLVMDRLLSGDVGFGKTEVALNGILASVLDGYQALFICPTTLLASQHFEELKNRLEPYGIKIAKIDGKTNTKDKNYFKKEFEIGNINVLIGTHSLLNIKSYNLALVIIDEEHKFGVKQKEKLKELRNNVHIFSMSATAIPRTLNLALSKIKGISNLLTPPSQRLGVRSFVKEYSTSLIKEVILREKRRGGQLFYIHNSIATIDTKKDDLLNILPSLKIAIIHSKIKQNKSEKIIEDFANGNYDILLATNIVESGLHLPNANSIIIEEANKFGIADLHQLRGRVGRGNKEGFCYFIVEDKNKITNSATKRLLALETNSYLGSGTALAYQDLEIRGGGNIIGEAQSGHIKQIGYGLYLKMLEEVLANLSGEIKEQKQTVDIKLTISAYISSDYINEDRIRLELYRRLSRVNEKNEVYDIQDEMEDRFGKLDTPTKQFIDLIIIKLNAITNNIKIINNYKTNITIIYNNDKKETIKASSYDDDDLINAIFNYFYGKMK